MVTKRIAKGLGFLFYLVFVCLGLTRILGRRAKRVIKRFYPERVKTSRKMLTILNEKYAHWQTVKTGEVIAKNGRRIPWYTYPAIEYLDQLDFSDKTVFEWGAGNSSIYWAQAAQAVTSIEDDPTWFGGIKAHQIPNLTIHLIQEKQAYINAIAATHQKYDVIIIDGSHRYECALAAPEHLADGGLIILDNADWFPESAKVLREAGLLQIDMSGFGAVARYTWTTTLFLHRNFKIISKTTRQPRPSIGAIPVPERLKQELDVNSTLST